MPEKSEQIFTPDVPEPPGTIFSNCIRVGDQIIMSGMTAGDGQGGVLGDGSGYEQSKACLEKIKNLVEAAGGAMDDVVKMVVYLTDLSHREAFGRARTEFFPDRRPCSTLIEISGLAQPGLVVEVDATAYLGSA